MIFIQIVHYSTESGRQPVKEFIEELPWESRYEILTLLRRLEAGETLVMPHARSVASIAHGLYEIRVLDAQGQTRVFYYTKVKGVIYLVHALRKKSQTIREKDRALILKRVGEVRVQRRR